MGHKWQVPNFFVDWGC